ncbi:hypothetical protein HOY34_12875 [Xinfangfangia sp. D13-10-4-6]|uniref:hypothetical protein n=1 Tax=Pseudogemmobacter hezensis TaxID=2737662 RepID=UPI001554497E|nr:hypothetical protein [Pseudogemmobacter hezensis]NPD16093.1 hypothetical protein [Pseudogemmobacter hezensis]
MTLRPAILSAGSAGSLAAAYYYNAIFDRLFVALATTFFAALIGLTFIPLVIFYALMGRRETLQA